MLDISKIYIYEKEYIIEELYNLINNIQVYNEIDSIKQSIIVESILIKIPNDIVWFKDNENKLNIIKNKNILLSIFNFINNNFKLKGLQYLIEFNNFKFNDLKRNYQRRILEHRIKSYIVRCFADNDDIVDDIIKRIYI